MALVDKHLTMADRPLSIDIRHPLLLKANDLVLLTREDGRSSRTCQGLGFSTAIRATLPPMRFGCTTPSRFLLMSSDEQGCAAGIALANRAFLSIEGRGVADHQISIRRSFVVVDDERTIWNDKYPFATLARSTDPPNRAAVL